MRSRDVEEILKRYRIKAQGNCQVTILLFLGIRIYICVYLQHHLDAPQI
jgi:hypothetical protein